jgi:glycosyltransferase involved in cell wall biosynthesis
LGNLPAAGIARRLERRRALIARAEDRRPVAVVIGALAPYTHVLYERLAAELDRPLHVLACSAREQSRQWELATSGGYRFEVLPGLRWYRSSIRNLYVNSSVIPRLAALRPAVAVLNDFAPTMLMAGLALRARGVPYGIRTDGVPDTDPGRRSLAHRLVRRALVGRAAFGIGASAESVKLLRSYGLLDGRAVVSPLFPAWRPQREPPPAAARAYDVLFCGMLNEEVKGARFFVDVVLGCLARGRPLKVRVTGDGPLRSEMTDRFAKAGIEARFDGFLQQDALEEAHASARLFLFPIRGDVWGIVVQEALQSGAAVIASPHSGAARELLAARGCGIVLPMDAEAWVGATLALLDDPARQAALRAAAQAALADLTPERAASAYLEVLLPILEGNAPR